MIPTIAIAIVMGVVPGFFLRPTAPAVSRVVERVTGVQAGARLELMRPTAYEHAGAGRAGRFPGTPDAERRQS